MRGWKTWLAVAGMVLAAGNDADNNSDYVGAMTKAIVALGMLGIGHKIEKKK
jgi:hypothetical protein